MRIKDHFGNVAALKCAVCQQGATIHHCHGGSMVDWFGAEMSPRWGQKQNDWLVIPLCGKHHYGEDGIDTGMGNIKGVCEWESHFGLQVYHLIQVDSMLPYSIWEMAGLPNPTNAYDSHAYRRSLRAAAQ